MRGFRYAALAVVFLFLLAGTSITQQVTAQFVYGNNQLPQTTATGGPKYGGTLITVVPGDPAYLNPVLQAEASTSGGTDSDPAYESLLETTLNNTLVPGLAQSWSVSPDGLTYTFHLVQNATWQDGVKFTSADVKYTFMSMIIPSAPSGVSEFGVITSIDTPDNYTAVFHLKSTWPSLLLLLASTFTAPIMPMHIWNNPAYTILTNPANQAPMGTGPFMFKEWVHGSHITYVKYPNYWRKGRPYLDQFVVQIVPDVTSQASSMLTGATDTMFSFDTPSAFLTLENQPGIVVQGNTPEVRNEGGQVLLYFNLNRPITANPMVRQAIAHAVNKSQILQLSYLGVGTVSKSIIPDQFTQFNDPNVPTYAYNLTLANQLLDNAGYPRAANGTRFSLSLQDSAGTAQAAGDDPIVKAQLAQVGINVVLNTAATATANTIMWTQRNFDLATRVILTGPDPTIAEASTFAANEIGKGVQTNAEGYNDSTSDALLAQAQTTLNQTLRVQDMIQWQNRIMAALPVLPTIGVAFWEAFNTQFVGLPTSQWGPVSQYLYRVWWTGGTPAAGATSATATSTTSTPTPVLTTPTTIATQPTTSTAAAPSGGVSSYLLPIGVVVIIIIIIAGILIARGRGKGAGTTPAVGGGATPTTK